MLTSLENFFKARLAVGWQRWLLLLAPVWAGLISGLLNFPLNATLYFTIAGTALSLLTMFYAGHSLADVLTRQPPLLLLGLLATGHLTLGLVKSRLPYVIVLFFAYGVALLLGAIGLSFEQQDKQEEPPTAP